MESSVKRECIYVDDFLRGIGKTTALVNFANRANLALIVPSNEHVNHIKRKFDMCVPVVSQFQTDSLIGTNLYVVFDEGVDVKRLSNLKVVTGFLRK